MVAGATMLSTTSGRKSPKEKNNKKDIVPKNNNTGTIPKNNNININNINNIKQQHIKNK